MNGLDGNISNQPSLIQGELKSATLDKTAQSSTAKSTVSVDNKISGMLGLIMALGKILGAVTSAYDAFMHVCTRINAQSEPVNPVAVKQFGGDKKAVAQPAQMGTGNLQADKLKRELLAAAPKTTPKALTQGQQAVLDILPVATKLDRPTLNRLLDDTLGSNLLRKYAKETFTLENLDFLKQVRDFKKNPSVAKFDAIVAEFVSQEGKKQVNINSIKRNSLETCNEQSKMSPSVFDKAEGEIAAMFGTDIKRDTLARVFNEGGVPIQYSK